MTQTRRKFSAQEKVALLRRHLVEKVPVSDLCDECHLAPNVFYRWQKEFFENGAAAFEHGNGPQFIARDFKEFVRIAGMTHVRISPGYPQSNGKKERFFQTLKTECIRPGTPLSLEDARRLVGNFVAHYNTRRLHSAIGYVTPLDKLEGRAEAIWAARDAKLAAAREARAARRAEARRHNEPKDLLTPGKEMPMMKPAGETEAGSPEPVEGWRATRQG